jgi:hypothetical protein
MSTVVVGGVGTGGFAAGVAGGGVGAGVVGGVVTGGRLGFGACRRRGVDRLAGCALAGLCAIVSATGSTATAGRRALFLATTL